MANLLWTVGLLVLAALLSRTDGKCADGAESCMSKMVNSGSLQEQCQAGRNVLSCIAASVNNDPQCTEEEKSQVQGIITGINKKLDEQGCSVLLSLTDGICADGVQSCASKMVYSGSVQEQCQAGRNLLSCMITSVKNDPQCTEDIKSQVQAAVDKTNKELDKLGCSGVSGLLSSLALCLGLSGLAYIFTSRL